METKISLSGLTLPERGGGGGADKYVERIFGPESGNIFQDNKSSGVRHKHRHGLETAL
jgi:hypothetical protein